MHTLYAAPFTCSLAVHIVLAGHDLPYAVQWVSRGPGRQIGDAAYALLNPKRRVPALVLPDGEVLTEIINILMHLDEAHGQTHTAADRRVLLQWLSFLATDLHQQLLSPLFDPGTPQATRDDVLQRLLPPVLAHLEATLTEREALLDHPSAADAYLLWALVLLRFGFPQAVATPALTAFRRRMLDRPGVRAIVAEQRRGG